MMQEICPNSHWGATQNNSYDSFDPIKNFNIKNVNI